MRALALVCLLTLAACASPRAACERNALYDLQILDRLIVETEQTIARGYALEREAYTRPGLEFCYGLPLDDDHFGMTYCNRTEIAYRERPVAANMAEERAKLAELKQRRERVAEETARKLAACRAQHPEG